MIQSPEGPDHTFKLPEPGPGGLGTAGRMRPLHRTPSFAQVPDLVAMTESVLAELDQEPVVVEVAVPNSDNKQTVGVSKFDVQWWIASSLGRNNSAHNVPRNVYEMAQGGLCARHAQELARPPRQSRTGARGHGRADPTGRRGPAPMPFDRIKRAKRIRTLAGRYHRFPVEILLADGVGPALAGR